MALVFGVLAAVGHGAPRFWIVPVMACWMALHLAALLWPPRPRAPRPDGHLVLRWATWRRALLAVPSAGLFASLGTLWPDPSMRVTGFGLAAVAGTGIWLATAGRVRLTPDAIEPLGWIRAKPAVPWSAITSVTPTTRLAASAVLGPSAGVLLGAGRPWPIRVAGGLDGYPEFLALVLQRAPAAFDALDPRERERLERIARLAAASAAPTREG